MHSNEGGHTILLGGIGGDSHSVGLTILRQSLAAHGYQVRYLGTQNTLADFFQMAGLANLVMISSMDGHARYYLREFPAFKREFDTNGTIWYLAGISERVLVANVILLKWASIAYLSNSLSWKLF